MWEREEGWLNSSMLNLTLWCAPHPRWEKNKPNKMILFIQGSLSNCNLLSCHFFSC
jgi:hypothetical protein